MENLYLYFSGTGNTRFAVRAFAQKYENSKYEIHSIEEKIDFNRLIKLADIVLIGHPIYGSDIPDIMKSFLLSHLASFENKKIMTLVTQMEFSGDGGSLVYYILKKAHVQLIASMHVKMPYNVVDFKLVTIRTTEEAKEKIILGIKQIDRYVLRLKSGKKVLRGRGFLSRPLGYISQRLWFKLLHKAFKKMVKIDHETCIMCKKCVKECPTGNLEIKNGKIVTNNICTLCYRCVNICPTKSIKIFGRKYPKKQYYLK